MKSDNVRSVFNSITAYQLNIIKIDKFDQIVFPQQFAQNCFKINVIALKAFLQQNMNQFYNNGTKFTQEFKFDRSFCRFNIKIHACLLNHDGQWLGFIQLDNIIRMNEEQEHRGLAGLPGEDYEPSIAESNVRSVFSQSPYDNLVKQFKEYVPRSQLLDLAQIRSSSNLKLKKYRQAAYYGEIVNGKRHGQGVMIYNNERVYEGNWQRDYKQGMGYEQFPNGSSYLGEYINGKPEGIGKYTWTNGEFYEGEWVNGLKHGSGMWKGTKGDSYVGEWRLGKAQGYGVHVWVNGDRYEGSFKNCLKHGQGTEKFANGDLYKGEYARGKPNGYGEYYWANGSYYKGGFKEGLREGHGMWKKGAGNSDKYEGEYLQDKKHGYGIFSWAGGNVYKGNYKEDIRAGFGEMYWLDGTCYKGSWLNGVQQGEGLLLLPGEGRKKGLFKANQLIQIYQQQQPRPKPRPGTIQKNQLEAIQQREHLRSVDARRKVNTTFEHRTNLRASRQARIPNKPQQLKPIQYKNTFTTEVQRPRKAPNQELPKKERIPHSAYYMHKLHKRVNTAQNESSQMAGRSRGEIIDQLKNFTRKIVGSKPPL